MRWGSVNLLLLLRCSIFFPCLCILMAGFCNLFIGCRKNYTEYCFFGLSFWREPFSAFGGCSTFNTAKLGTWICNMGSSNECCTYIKSVNVWPSEIDTPCLTPMRSAQWRSVTDQWQVSIGRLICEPTEVGFRVWCFYPTDPLDINSFLSCPCTPP